MKDYLLNPLTFLIIGAVLIGVGIDCHKFSVIIPGVAFGIGGFIMGCVWLARDA